MNFVQTVEFDSLPWQPNDSICKEILKIISEAISVCVGGGGAGALKLCRNVHNISHYVLLPLFMYYHCYGNLKFPLAYYEKSESRLSHCRYSENSFTEMFLE